MHIVDMVYFWARTTPRHPAVIRPEGFITYRSLAEGVERAAEYFAGTILDRSKPVTVSIASDPKMLVASLGLLRAGFSMIASRQLDVPHIPAAESNVVVIDREAPPQADRTNIRFDESWVQTGAGGQLPSSPLPQPRTRDANTYFFTSGTTGRPKLVIRNQKAWDQRILFNSSSAFADYDRVLSITGLTNSMGFGRAYEALYEGKTLCLAPPGQPMLWLVNTYDIDLIIASPQQALALAEIQEKVTRYPLAALKTVWISGASPSPDGIEHIKSHLCRNVVLAYSSTEAGPAATAPHDMIAHIPNAVGFVIPGAEVQIVDETDNVLPAGSEGLVRLRTPLFLHNFEIDDPGVWFYPGDVGWLTDDGVLCIAGRSGDVFNRGGVKRSVTDFEDFLRTCPGVNDAGVCTLMGQSGFEEVWIGITLAPSTDLATLRQAIESNRDFANNFDRLFAVEAIPRGAMGKVQRDELRKMLQAIAANAASEGTGEALTPGDRSSD